MFSPLCLRFNLFFALLWGSTLFSQDRFDCRAMIASSSEYAEPQAMRPNLARVLWEMMQHNPEVETRDEPEFIVTPNPVELELKKQEGVPYYPTQYAGQYHLRLVKVEGTKLTFYRALNDYYRPGQYLTEMLGVHEGKFFVTQGNFTFASWVGGILIDRDILSGNNLFATKTEEIPKKERDQKKIDALTLKMKGVRPYSEPYLAFRKERETLTHRKVVEGEIELTQIDLDKHPHTKYMEEKEVTVWRDRRDGQGAIVDKIQKFNFPRIRTKVAGGVFVAGYDQEGRLVPVSWAGHYNQLPSGGSGKHIEPVELEDGSLIYLLHRYKQTFQDATRWR